MKKLLTILFVVVITSKVNAQLKAGGLGLTYGSQAGLNANFNERGKMGLNFKGIYEVTDAIDVAAQFVYYFPSTHKNSSNEVKSSAWSASIDGHYNFIKEEKYRVFGYGGVVLSGRSVKWTYSSYYYYSIFLPPGLRTQTDSDSDTEFGINLGAGGLYNFSDQLSGIGKIGYESTFEQMMMTFSVLYHF